VRAEQGCIEYGPMIDVASGLDAQTPLRDNVVTMVEKWESPAALTAHLKTPHMAEFFRQAGAIQQGLSLRVLQPA
jgi:quinol monooxygenase YgiN